VIRRYTGGGEEGSKLEDIVGFTLVALANAFSIVMGTFYVFATLVPTSQISFDILGHTKGCYVVYLVVQLVLALLSWLFDSALVSITNLCRPVKILLYIFLSLLVWWPFFFSAVLAAVEWDRPCAASETTIRLRAVNPCTAQPGEFTTAYIPESMGGEMQLHQIDPTNGVYSTYLRRRTLIPP
jgi:hypothetical protein